MAGPDIFVSLEKEVVKSVQIILPNWQSPPERNQLVLWGIKNEPAENYRSLRELYLEAASPSGWEEWLPNPQIDFEKNREQ